MVDPGRVINDICSLQDFIPTFAAAAGEPDLVDKVKKGYQIGDQMFRVHLDGVNLLPFLKGDQEESPREGFLYWSDDGDLLALRVRRWKVVFAKQRHTGFAVWREPFSHLRWPKIFDLRSDPFERGDESDVYYGLWAAERTFMLYPAQESPVPAQSRGPRNRNRSAEREPRLPELLDPARRTVLVAHDNRCISACWCAHSDQAGLVAFPVVVHLDGVPVSDRANNCDCGCCEAARKGPASEVRFLLAHRSVQSIIVKAVTGDQAEGLQYHVLPTDDPLLALNILREAAGLQPLSDEHDDQGG